MLFKGSAASTMLILVPLILLLLAGPAVAEDDDIIILKEGGMYKGTILSQRGSSVKMRVNGKILTIKKKEIRKIIAKPKPEAEYKKRAKEVNRKDVEGNFQLAMWCKAQGLKTEMKKHLDYVLKVDPEHEGARIESGFGNYEGEWHPVTELESRGLAFFDGKWMPKAELEAAMAKMRAERIAAMSERTVACDQAVEILTKEVGHSFRSLAVRGGHGLRPVSARPDAALRGARAPGLAPRSAGPRLRGHGRPGRRGKRSREAHELPRRAFRGGHGRHR